MCVVHRSCLMTNSLQFPYLWLIFLLLSSGGWTNRNCRKQKGVGKKSKGKLTFCLNEGGTGHRDAAVTMQRKVLFFSLLLACSALYTKTRFMTSPAPPYFSNWCTLWVVYLGLRALQLSLSVSSLRDLQHPTRGNKKDTVSSVWDICLVHACFHKSLLFVLMQKDIFHTMFSFFLSSAATAAKNTFEWTGDFFDRFSSS